MSYQLIQGSAHHLPMIPDKSIHTLVTSPPYYGLRAYEGDQSIEWPTVEYAPMAGLAPIRVQGCEPDCEHVWGNEITQREQSGRHRLEWETGGNLAAKVPVGPVSQGAYCTHCGGWRGGLGLEPTIEMYIGHLILCLREWHRILRDDGTCWVNLGDSYNGSGGSTTTTNLGKQYDGVSGSFTSQARKVTGLKPKDLCMIPARFALAAQADGWYLRSAIVWAKGISFRSDYAGSSMPSSAEDRPALSYEMVYMLSKRPQYYFDMEAVKEQGVSRDHNRFGNKNAEARLVKNLTGNMRPDAPQETDRTGRNLRSVWAISPRGYKEAHFATWPEALVTPMIKASTSAHGVCAKCGAPWRRVVEKQTPEKPYEYKEIGIPGERQNRGRRPGSMGNGLPSTEIGWQPTCNCGCDEVIPATVIDPFNGSGTSGRAALKLGRSYIGVDISKEYLEGLSPARMSNVQMEMPL